MPVLSCYPIPCWMPVLVERFYIMPEQAESFCRDLSSFTTADLAMSAGMTESQVRQMLESLSVTAQGIFDDCDKIASRRYTIYLDRVSPRSCPAVSTYHIWERSYAEAFAAVPTDSVLRCVSRDRGRAFSAAMAYRESGYGYAFAECVQSREDL